MKDKNPYSDSEASRLITSNTPSNVVDNKPAKFFITKYELLIFFPFGFTLMMYNLYLIGKKSNEIQEITPMKNVEKSWFGFYRDDSDFQWRVFREIAFLFIGFLAIFNIISFWIKKTYALNPTKKFNNSMIYYIITGVGFLIFLFDFGGFVFWLFFSFVNYLLTQVFGYHRIFPLIIWIYSLCLIYFLFFYKEFPYNFVRLFSQDLGDWLYNSFQHAMVQWTMIYNMTILRQLSYSFDRMWEFQGKYKIDLGKHKLRCQSCQQNKLCYKVRSEQYLDRSAYNSLKNYYAYLLYVPLFTTGPQITFNGFISQVNNNQQSIPNKQVFFYALRALNNMLILEIYTHSNFASALSKNPANKEHWIHFSASQCLFMGFLNLIFIWLKFLTIWRLARAAALIDGIDSPENMNRCIFNNYCFEGFWRSWHRGFNQWLIRYIFIPLGGSKNKVWNIWFVFTFVAIWHDITIDLLVWAWLICAALIPEIIIKTWAAKQKHLWRQRWFTYFTGFFATIYIWLMCISNLIGFGNGYYNIKIVMEKVIYEPGGWYEFLQAMLFFYPLTFWQFGIRNRESEYNQGTGF